MRFQKKVKKANKGSRANPGLPEVFLKTKGDNNN